MSEVVWIQTRRDRCGCIITTYQTGPGSILTRALFCERHTPRPPWLKIFAEIEMLP